MMTHHVVHESFKNNISNNTHNIAQGGHPVFGGGGANAPLAPLNATLVTILAGDFQRVFILNNNTSTKIKPVEIKCVTT